MQAKALPYNPGRLNATPNAAPTKNPMTIGLFGIVHRVFVIRISLQY